MRPWQIVIASAVVATVIVAALVVLGVPGTSADNGVPVVTPAVVATAGLVWLGAYGVVAALLTAIALFREFGRACRHVERAAAPGTVTHAPLVEAMPAMLPRLRNRLTGMPYEVEPNAALSMPADRIVPAAHLRGACVGLYFARLVRTQHLTALALLVAAELLTLRGGQAAAPATIWPELSMVQALAAAIGLLIIAALIGRVALGGPIAALVEAFGRLRVANTQTRLLREALELIRRFPSTPAAAEPGQIIDSDRIEAQIAAAKRDSLNAIGALTAAVDGIGRSLRSNFEELKTVLRAAAPAPPEAYEEITAELRNATLALNEAVARIEAAPALAIPDHAPAEHAASPQNAQARLSSELQALLREIDAPARAHEP